MMKNTVNHDWSYMQVYNVQLQMQKQDFCFLQSCRCVIHLPRRWKASEAACRRFCMLSASDGP